MIVSFEWRVLFADVLDRLMTGPRNATSAVALSIGQEKPFSSEKFRNAWFRKYGIGGRPPFTRTSMLRR